MWTVLPQLHVAGAAEGEQRQNPDVPRAFAMDALHLLGKIYEAIFLRTLQLSDACGLNAFQRNEMARRAISCYEALLRQMPMGSRGSGNKKRSKESGIVESILRLKTLNTGKQERAALEDAIEGLIVATHVASDPKNNDQKGMRNLQSRNQTRTVAAAAMRTGTPDLQARIDSLCEACSRDAALNGLEPSKWFDAVVAQLSEGGYHGLTHINDPMHTSTLQLLDLCRHFLGTDL